MDVRPTVSVVVPFLGSDAQLSRLLDALVRLDRRPGDELIVADNRSTQPPSQARAGVVLHPAGGVRSPGFARNRGAARAVGEWLVFLDADTEPEPDLLDAYFAPPPAAATAVLAGRIIDAPDSGDLSGPSLAARHAVRRRHMDDRVTTSRASFAYAQTANCAVRRHAFVEIGGFDEAILAAEDADLCFRLAAGGWGLEERPQARVRHHPRNTVSAMLRQLARHGAGAGWCNARHPGSFPPPTPWGLGVRVMRDLGRAARLYLGSDRDAAASAALEAAEAVAFEFGRLLPNRARR